MPVSARTLKALMEAGVCGDKLVEIVGLIDADMTPPKDTAAERRRAYDRERKRNSTGNSTGASLTNSTGNSTGIPPENALKGTELNGTDIKEEVVVVGARDPTAPAPDPEKASAVAIIEAFDQARASAHGESRRRPWPQARDFAIGVSWVKAGATAEIIMPVFEDLCRRKAGSGEDPIDGLVYFQKIIPKFLSDISKPMPEANPHGTNTRPISARDSRVSTDAFRGALAEVFADVVDDGGELACQCSADTSFGDS